MLPDLPFQRIAHRARRRGGARRVAVNAQGFRTHGDGAAVEAPHAPFTGERYGLALDLRDVAMHSAWLGARYELPVWPVGTIDERLGDEAEPVCVRRRFEFRRRLPDQRGLARHPGSHAGDEIGEFRVDDRIRVQGAVRLHVRDLRIQPRRLATEVAKLRAQLLAQRISAHEAAAAPESLPVRIPGMRTHADTVGKRLAYR